MSSIPCRHCDQSNPALTEAPFPGEVGERILSEICANCWQAWLDVQVMHINENRLSLINPDARQFLREKMEEFLFDKKTDKPEGYQPIESSE